MVYSLALYAIKINFIQFHVAMVNQLPNYGLR